MRNLAEESTAKDINETGDKQPQKASESLPHTFSGTLKCTINTDYHHQH